MSLGCRNKLSEALCMAWSLKKKMPPAFRVISFGFQSSPSRLSSVVYVLFLSFFARNSGSTAIFSISQWLLGIKVVAPPEGSISAKVSQILTAFPSLSRTGMRDNPSVWPRQFPSFKHPHTFPGKVTMGRGSSVSRNEPSIRCDTTSNNFGCVAKRAISGMLCRGVLSCRRVPQIPA